MSIYVYILVFVAALFSYMYCTIVHSACPPSPATGTVRLWCVQVGGKGKLSWLQNVGSGLGHVCLT